MLQDIVENLVERYTLGDDTPGFSILLHEQDAKRFSANVGVCGPAQTPISCKSNFRLASVSKQFTAVSILQLVERGALSLDTTLCEVFPKFPDYGRSIKVRHLLSHTSGLRDYEDQLDQITEAQIADRQILSLACTQNETLFTPGSRYQYSNGAYCLLALMVAKITGLSFEAYLSANIFPRAGMTDTRLNSSADIPNRVFGYQKENNGKWLLADQNKTSATQGDGGIYSSVADLARWQTALYSQRTILSDTYLEFMTSPHATTAEGESYGCGIFIATIFGRPYYRHWGESTGFSNALFFFPEEGISLCILSNLEGVDMVEVGKSMAAYI